MSIQSKSMRAVIAVLVSALTSGCVSGLLLRAVTWPADPREFWVVMSDTGLEVDYANNPDNKSTGECTVVWNGTLIENMRIAVGLWEEEDVLWCESNVYEALSASAKWYGEGARYFDLSLPKSEREGPLVLDTEAIVERLKTQPVHITLGAARFGSSFFCNVVVTVESMSAVLNAGVDKDVHVYIGTGSRRCDFG